MLDEEYEIFVVNYWDESSIAEYTRYEYKLNQSIASIFIREKAIPKFH